MIFLGSQKYLFSASIGDRGASSPASSKIDAENAAREKDIAKFLAKDEITVLIDLKKNFCKVTVPFGYATKIDHNYISFYFVEETLIWNMHPPR